MAPGSLWVDKPAAQTEAGSQPQRQAASAGLGKAMSGPRVTESRAWQMKPAEPDPATRWCCDLGWKLSDDSGGPGSLTLVRDSGAGRARWTSAAPHRLPHPNLPSRKAACRPGSSRSLLTTPKVPKPEGCQVNVQDFRSTPGSESTTCMDTKNTTRVSKP